jgi:hypothetical protein
MSLSQFGILTFGNDCASSASFFQMISFEVENV